MRTVYICTLALGAQLLLHSAQAATISHAEIFRAGINYLIEPIEVAGDYNFNFNQIDFVELPRFDAHLGTLQAVRLSFDSEYHIRADGFARDATDGSSLPFFREYDTSLSTRMNLAMLVSLFDPFTSNVVLNKSLADSCSAYESNILPELSEGVDCYVRAGDSGLFHWDFPLFGADLSLFTGLDPINLFAQANGSMFGACDSNDGGDYCHLTPIITWTGHLNLEYDYLAAETGGGGGGGGGGGATPVPEPTSISLIAAGLLAFGWRRRPLHLRGRV